MGALIIGKEKIIKYLSKYDFQKIKLSKGADTVYIHKTKEGENQEDLVNDFNEWVEEFIEPTDFRDYKLELFGTYSNNPEAKLSSIVKVVVAFNYRNVAINSGDIYNRATTKENNNPIDVDKYLAVATENATLKAHIERLEEKMDELVSIDEDDDEDIGSHVPPTFTEAINQTLIGKMDTIVDVVLGMLMKNQNTAPAINGVVEYEFNDITEIIAEFQSIHPDIADDLKRLLKLAQTQPDFFSMLIKNLRNMV
jgi:hypothetical protein